MNRNQVVALQSTNFYGRTRWIWALAVLLIAGGCSSEKPDQGPVVSVQVAPVEKTTIEHTVIAQAILFPKQQSAIVPKISAPVQKFLVQRGSAVKQGQLLAVLENRDLSAAAQDTKGALDQAQATYETTTAATLPEEIRKAEGDAQTAQQALDAQDKIFESRQQLFEQGALPRKELDQSRVDVTQARNQSAIANKHLDALLAIGKQQELKAAAGQLESAKGKYLGAAAQLSYSEIRSPISGVITERPLYPGEMAAVGIPLLTVMDISSVIAKAHIPQSAANVLKAGDAATILAPGEAPGSGKVTLVSPAVDANSTTVEIWVEAPNLDGKLRPGTAARVQMVARTVSDAVIIPASALLKIPEGATTVMVAGDDGRAHQVSVEAGIRQGDRLQIIKGLSGGEKVITTAAYGLPDNARIKIAEATPTSSEPDVAGGRATAGPKN